MAAKTSLEVTFSQTGTPQYVFFPLTGVEFLPNCKYSIGLWLKRMTNTSVPIDIRVGRSLDDMDGISTSASQAFWNSHSFLWLSAARGSDVWLAIGTQDAVTLRISGISVRRYWPSQTGPQVTGVFLPGQMYRVGVTRMEDEP